MKRLFTLSAGVALGALAFFQSNLLSASGEWGYRGELGPAQWGKLRSEFQLCESGKHQSPVNLMEQVGVESASPIHFLYRASEYRGLNNGHTLQLNYSEGNFLRIGNQKFQLVQMHFHSPSEHLLGGKRFPMEIHLVHRDSAGHLAVLGVMVESGRESELLRSFFLEPPRPGKEKEYTDQWINASYFIPKNQDRFQYQGSLTTPPCSEGVQWIVFKSPISLSAAQIASFRHHYDGNARPVQLKAERKIASTPVQPTPSP